MRIPSSLRVLMFALMMLAIPATSSAGIILSIGIAPPPLPVYEQPLCPGDGYIWTPGYWAYADDGYFWVPGTWVLIPEPGFLWTPGYWGWGDGVFVFHEGYWGPHIGFYGGINYGFGYVGVGYEGGYWNNGAFYYNRSVNNVRNVRNVYSKTVVVNTMRVNSVSYNGGAGGISAHPTAEEEAAAHERHIPATAVQTQHTQAASTNRQLYESVNHGKPAVAGTSRPGEFNGHGVIKAKAAAKSYRPPTARTAAPERANNAAPRPATAFHPNDLPPAARPAPASTGNAKLDKKYQQQQEKLHASQEQERQKLQQNQQKEHQQLARGKANQAKQQQVEQKHQQQTQQLAQRHASQQQKLQVQQQRATRTPKGKP